MRKAVIIVFISLTCLFAKAQSDTAFIYTYGGIQNDNCNQIRPTYDKGYIMIGTTNSFCANNTSFYIIKTDSSLKKQWSEAIGGPLNQGGYSVAPTFDHGYAFLGFTDSYGAGGYDVFLVKTDSVGNVKWQKTYGGSDWDFGYSIRQTSDSGFVICGLTYSYGAGNGDMYVIRTDKKGDTLWTRAIGGKGYDVGNSVYVHSSNLYAIVGSTTSFSSGDTDMFIVELNNNGKIIKDTTYAAGNNRSDIAYSVEGTSDGGFLINGNTDSLAPGIPDQIIYKTDSMAKVQWVNYCNNINQGKDAIQSPDGNIVTVGATNYFGAGGYDLKMYHLSIAGGWFLAGGTVGSTQDEYGNSLAIAKNGNVVFAGCTDSYGQGLFDVYLVRVKNDSLNINQMSYHFYKDTLCSCPLGLATQTAIQPDVRIFPNPMITIADIIVQGQIAYDYRFNLYDVFGRCVMQDIPARASNHGQSVGHISRNNLSSGIYFYELYGKEGRVASGKLVVE